MPSESPALRDQFAKHLEIETVSWQEGHAKVRLVFKPYFLNGAGLVHGGVIFSLADYAFALAANSPSESGLAVNASINFIKAARVGDELFAEAKLISRSRRLGTYQITVTDQNGVVLALAQSMAYLKQDRSSDAKA